jgi:hypothetical protein
MDFAAALRRGWAIIQLDRQAMREVLTSSESLVPALVILAIGGALLGVGALNPMAIVWNVVFVPVSAFIATGVLHFLSLAFGGQGRFAALFGGFGHGVGLLYWVGVVPLAGPFLLILALLWGAFVVVHLVEENYALSRGQAIAVVVIPAAFFCACVVVSAIMFGAGVAAIVGAATAAGN